MIGEKITYEEIPDSGEIEVNKKKIRWWDYYKFKDKEQYLEWKEFAIKELSFNKLEHKFDLIDMTYGLNYKIINIKIGQMEIF